MKKLKGKFTTILNKIITDKSISGNEFKIWGIYQGDCNEDCSKTTWEIVTI